RPAASAASHSVDMRFIVRPPYEIASMKLPLGGRGQGGLIGVGEGEPDPHSSGAMPRYRAEDEEWAALPRDEPDITALSAGDTLLQLCAGRVLKGRGDGTDGNRRAIGDDLH